MENRTIEGFRLSPQQKHLWSLQQGSQAYLAQCAVRLEGNLQAEALRAALETVIDRHEILRTTFARLPGMNVPVQVIAESGTPSWDEIDLSGMETAEQNSKLEELFEEESRRPFDFEHGPLIHLTLAMLAADKHVLLLSLPSLCADRWTLRNLVGEVSRFYAASSPDDETSEGPLQYADFCEWQNELLEAEDENAEQGRVYWQKQSASSVSPLTLPFEAKLAEQTAFEPAALPFEIDADTIAKIDWFVKDNETSTSNFLLACWQTLLWRLAGESGIVVGVAYDGRKFKELEEALGLFAKSLPVECRFAGDFRFSEILKQVDETARSAYEWQEYFAVEQSAGKTGGGSNLLIGYEFGEQPQKNHAAGVSFSVDKLRSHIEHFKIKLSCARANDSLTTEINYDPSLFGREDIERIAEYFRTLLQSVLKNPGEQVSKLELLSERDRHQLLIEFNQTIADYSASKCIHELFEEQVARTPEMVAVVFEDQQLTYAECNARANQLARILRQRGVGPDVRVGLCLDRSTEMIVGMLGVLKAGGAYVPLNPDHPKARLAQQLADLQSPVLITQEKLLGQLPDFDGGVICLDRDQAVFEREEKTDLERAAAPENLVYVIYTSGSTGVPKGVAVTHRNLVNYTHYICRKLQLNPSLKAEDGLHFATVSTIGADLGNTCIFPSLVSGGCLHIIDYDVAMDGGRFASYVAEHPIDVLKIVPSHLGALLGSQESGNILPRKYLILGGEALSWELIKRISQTAATCRVINHYGPTETTVGSLTYDLQKDDANARISSTVPIGRPIANSEVYILNQHLNPVPLGVPGELYIGGAGLAQGYLNQPERTTERFIPHPFSQDENARLYKTGDLARYLPDGSVEFLGRTDTQVKIRGYRIELGEIEAIIRQYTAVRETVVLAREDEPGNQRLVAYVVPQQRAASITGELRSFLKEHLPEYMLPTSFVALDALPLTANGKVDRKALPAPEQIRLETEAAHVAPQTEVERTIAGVWQEALRIEQVGVHNNFFDLGGHSLLMVKVHNKLRGVVGRDLSIVDMFKYPTISSLANYLSREQTEQPALQPDLERAEMRREAMKQQRQARQERQGRRG